MKEFYFHGRRVLIPFLRPEELKTFESVSEDGINKLNDTIEKFTAAQTYAESQKILVDYVSDIDAKNTANTFYKSMLSMLLNLRRNVHNSETL